MEYKVPIKSLKAVINPLDGEMWKVEAIDPQEVRDAADQRQFGKLPWAQVKNELPAECHRLFHITRIAWLLGEEMDGDDPHKLMLAVSKDRVWFYDGNHRVAAAIVRGDDNIILHIAESGEVDLALLLPGLTPLSDGAAAEA
jgi:hypothetical protein